MSKQKQPKTSGELVKELQFQLAFLQKMPSDKVVTSEELEKLYLPDLEGLKNYIETNNISKTDICILFLILLQRNEEGSFWWEALDSYYDYLVEYVDENKTTKDSTLELVSNLLDLITKFRLANITLKQVKPFLSSMIKEVLALRTQSNTKVINIQTDDFF